MGFSIFLKSLRVVAFLMAAGNLFCSFGPDIAKDLSRKVWHLLFGILSNLFLPNLVSFSNSWYSSSFWRHSGAWSFRHLYTNVNSSNLSFPPQVTYAIDVWPMLNYEIYSCLKMFLLLNFEFSEALWLLCLAAHNRVHCHNLIKPWPDLKLVFDMTP